MSVTRWTTIHILKTHLFCCFECCVQSFPPAFCHYHALSQIHLQVLYSLLFYVYLHRHINQCHYYRSVFPLFCLTSRHSILYLASVHKQYLDCSCPAPLLTLPFCNYGNYCVNVPNINSPMDFL